MVAKAIEAATPTLRDVASRIGVSYGTIRAYKIGERNAPPAVMRRLASALRHQAAQLETAADRLEARAERDH